MQKPVFVKVEDYQEVISSIEILKNKLKETRRVLDRLNELKEMENNELSAWANEISDIERKINFIDKSMLNE